MDAVSLSNRLESNFNKFLITATRVKKVRESDVYLAKRDVDTFYEGIFLKTVTSFESFVEELFIGLLYKKYDLPTRKKIQKIAFEDRKTVLNFLLLNGQKKYLDLLPFEKLKKNYKVFYKDENPFAVLNDSQKDILNQVFILRNAIAHNSITANKKFKKFLEDNHPALISIKTPSQFLQTLNNPNQTMFEVYLIELNSIANSFCNFR